MKYQIDGLIAIEFLTDNERNERGIKTIRHRAIGEIQAESKENAKIKSESQIADFIDTNYPVRWRSEIERLRIVQI